MLYGRRTQYSKHCTPNCTNTGRLRDLTPNLHKSSFLSKKKYERDFLFQTCIIFFCRKYRCKSRKMIEYTIFLGLLCRLRVQPFQIASNYLPWICKKNKTRTYFILHSGHKTERNEILFVHIINVLFHFKKLSKRLGTFWNKALLNLYWVPIINLKSCVSFPWQFEF